MDTISLSTARRIALAAQGFDRSRPAGLITMRHVQQVIDRVAQFQIDSINVCQRAHYFPLFSRLGNYDISLLDRAAGSPPRRLFEYLGHAASFIDVELQPFLRFRQQNAADEAWSRIVSIQTDHPDLVDRIAREIQLNGVVTARQLEQVGLPQRGNWGWNWTATKTVVEWLWWCGKVTPAYRNRQFERVYDIPERVLPNHILARDDVSSDDAHRELIRRAATALGIATENCLRDYFRTKNHSTKQAIDELVQTEELLPVRVAGWSEKAYLWYAAKKPRRIDTQALLSPFDSLIFERNRLQSLFGSVYRIEIYVPVEKRVWGYYVYPFLVNDRIVARVDLKADRQQQLLIVQAAWLEPENAVFPNALPATEVAHKLALELLLTAQWLHLNDVQVMARGDLSGQLLRALQHET